MAEGLWRMMGDPTSVLTANGYYGEIVTFGGSGASTAYNTYYWSSSSAWAGTLADSAVTSSGLLAMAIGTQYNQGMVLRGYIYNSSWNWTVGSILYLSPSAGLITATQPNSGGDIVRVVGYAISADLIYFNPSQDWIEIS